MWGIEMSRLEVRERERLVNRVVLCGMVGLVMALVVATVMVYEESSADHPQPAGTPHDRGRLHAETTAEQPSQ